jgi:hypothetical protein
MNALIYMVPLTVKRDPIGKPFFCGTIPRDGEFHRVSGSFVLDKTKEMPHFVRIWADDKAKDFEVAASAPLHMRKLNTITFYQDLRVLPRSK